MKIDLTKTNGSSPPSRPTTHADRRALLSTDEILTISELAAWLKMKPGQVYELTRSRGQCRSLCRLPILRFHRKALRFRRSDVQKWLDTLAENGRGQ